MEEYQKDTEVTQKKMSKSYDFGMIDDNGE